MHAGVRAAHATPCTTHALSPLTSAAAAARATLTPLTPSATSPTLPRAPILRPHAPLRVPS